MIFLRSPHPAILQFIEEHAFTTPISRSQLIKLVTAVANIPWGEGRTIEDVLVTRKIGTCTGKHIVLRECLQAINVPSRISVCTFHWSEQNIALPSNLRAILKEGEWVHGHNFLQLQNERGEWIDVDVTWDPPLKPYGFCTFPEDWNGNTAVFGLHSFIDHLDNADLAKKDEWIKALTANERDRRERFLRGFFAWVKTLRISRTP